MLIKGNQLTKEQRSQVLSAFVHRHTVEHPARWAGDTVPTQTDSQWIEDHAFHFIKDGSRLSAKHRHCVPEYMTDAESYLNQLNADGG